MKTSAADEEKSEFNSAIATLKRIDDIKKALIMATMSDNVELKWKALKAFYGELISIMDNEDDKLQRDRMKEVRKSFNKYMEDKWSGAETIPMSVIDNIDDWEYELKNIEQKYGMNIPKAADPRYALAGKSKRR